jgi:DNA-binding beta-propeller fold protein YncE
VAVINLQSGQLIAHWKTGRRPYRILVSPGGKQLVVSSWADASVYQHDANAGTLLAKTRVAPHPTDMVWLDQPAPAAPGEASYRARIFVAAANTNSVYALGVTQDGQLNMLESINVSLTALHPLGMTPSALGVDKSGTRLYVVCSDANAVAVADISGDHSRVLGFIPTGWYPTAVRALNDGQLAILNGKGLGSYPNPKGPNPSVRAAPVHEGSNAPSAVQYVAHIQTGTVAFLPAPNEDQLSAFTSTVMQNTPYSDDLIYGPPTDEQQAYFSSTEGHPSPIKHVIYIIKENRTYDQVLGDIEKGNGDKSLVLFGEQITPNLHQIARDFILYDNFYENADVSADGHNWASAAIAPDYTVKMWPSEYGHRRHKYDFEGTEPANNAPAGYIWDNALQKGITVRDYGYWSSNLPLNPANGGRQINKANDPVLQNNMDMNYRGWDLEYSDVNRAKEFAREWSQFDAKGDAPQFMIVRMGNDHTQGTKVGALTPFAYAAQNDQGVGMLVNAVSHGKLWASTAIFVIEDDAQNGPDHVDSHRAPAFVISPYTHRGVVDSKMYNQTSILRTMELILGLRPMTHFDAAAPAMFATFSRQPDTRPYNLIPPKTSLTDRNEANAPGAQQSGRMDFSNADLVDDDELNAVLWRAIKHSDPPPPTRSAFAR